MSQVDKPKSADVPAVKVDTSNRAAMTELARRATTTPLPIRNEELRRAPSK